MSTFYNKFKTYIEENGLLECGPDSSVVIGVSGGSDSVCLLLLFKRLSDETKLNINAVHINHCLRGESAKGDEEFVKELCKQKNVPLEIFKVDVNEYAKAHGLGEEEAGREVRYNKFFEAAKKINAKVAVAHHMDDNAETVIYNLIRGSNLSGISGMQPETINFGCKIIRPLLFASKKDIENFLNEEGQDYCTDQTNEDTSYARNRIRNNILKEMNEINPHATEHILSLAKLAREADKLADEEIKKQYGEYAMERADGIYLNFKGLSACRPVIAKGVIYNAVAKVAEGKKNIAAVHIDDVYGLLGLENGKKIILPRNIMAVKQNEVIKICRRDEKNHIEEIVINKDFVFGEKKSISAGGREVSFEIVAVDDNNRAELTEKKLYTKAFDYDKIFGSIFLGSRREGDHIALPKGTKSLRRLMTDHKIPRDERDEVLILRDEENVIWAVGLRISELHKITAETKCALKVTISGECDE